MPINGALYSRSGVTIGSTEYSIVNGSTTIATATTECVAQLWVDCANMAAGDEYEIAVQEKVRSGGTQRRTVLASLVGAQGEPWIGPPLQLAHGWDYTIKKISGTDRAFDATIRAVT